MEVVGFAAAVISITKMVSTGIRIADDLYDIAQNAPSIGDHIRNSALSLRSFGTTVKTAQAALNYHCPNAADSPVVQYMIEHNLPRDLKQQSRYLRKQIIEVVDDVSKIRSRFDLMMSYRWRRVKPAIDALTVPMEGLKSTLNLIVNIVILETLSLRSGESARSAEELEEEMQVAFLKSVIREQIKTIWELRHEHHYNPAGFSEAPEGVAFSSHTPTAVDPQSALCHLAQNMAETERIPSTSPETFIFSKPVRQRSSRESKNGREQGSGRRHSKRLSDGLQAPQPEPARSSKWGAASEIPLGHPSPSEAPRRESKHSVSAPLVEEVERQVPATIVPLAVEEVPRRLRRVSKLEEPAVEETGPEEPSEAVSIRREHVDGGHGPVVEETIGKHSVKDVRATERRRSRRVSTDPRVENKAVEDPPAQRGSINGRATTREAVENLPEDYSVEGGAVEERSPTEEKRIIERHALTEHSPEEEKHVIGEHVIERRSPKEKRVIEEPRQRADKGVTGKHTIEEHSTREEGYGAIAAPPAKEHPVEEKKARLLYAEEPRHRTGKGPVGGHDVEELTPGEQREGTIAASSAEEHSAERKTRLPYVKSPVEENTVEEHEKQTGDQPVKERVSERSVTRERSIRNGVVKERPVVKGLREEWLSKTKKPRVRKRASTQDEPSETERRSVEGYLGNGKSERSPTEGGRIVQDAPIEKRSATEGPFGLVEHISTKAEVFEERSDEKSHGLATRKPFDGPPESESQVIEKLPFEVKTAKDQPMLRREVAVKEIKDDRRHSEGKLARRKLSRHSPEKPVSPQAEESKDKTRITQERKRLVQGHLSNESSIRRMRHGGLKHGDTIRGYINLGDVHHEEVVAYVDRSIRKNLISLALADELHLSIKRENGVLFYEDDTVPTAGRVTFNWGNEEVSCSVVDKLKYPLIFGRAFLSEGK